jgi:tetratricopeptide (TPR) repeat protein
VMITGIAESAPEATPNPQSTVPDVTLQAAYSLLREGKAADAKALTDELLRSDPGSAPVHVVRALAEETLGDNQAALDDLNAALSTDPNVEKIHLQKCDVLYRLHRLGEAIDACSRAIVLDPNDVNAYNERGVAHAARGDAVNEVAAVVDLDHSIALDPNNAWSYSERCELKRELKRYRDAIPDCSRALALDPGNSRTWFTRAMLDLRVADYRRAEDDFKSSLQQGPTDEYVYCGLAQAQNELGKLSAALANANLCLGKLPDSMSARLTRAKIYAKMGNVQQAIADARLALSIAHGFQDSKGTTEAQKLLTELSRTH